MGPGAANAQQVGQLDFETERNFRREHGACSRKGFRGKDAILVGGGCSLALRREGKRVDRIPP